MGATLRTEPALDRAALVGALAADFGITVASIEFVPVGYATACYSVLADDGSRWFVKCWPPGTPGGDVDDPWLRRTLGLLRELDAEALPGRVPVPLTARSGHPWSRFTAVPFAVFPFIDGIAPASWPHEDEAFWMEAGRTIAAIHRARSGADLPIDDLQLEALVISLASACDRMDPDPMSLDLAEALNELLRETRAEFDAQSWRLAVLSDTPLPDELVLCHTDFGGDNLIVAPDGTLVVLDWDTAVRSVPEQDLRVGAEGEHLGAFLDAYWSGGGERALHPGRFEFYLRRRALEDLTARFVRIADGGLSDDDAADAIDGIRRWGFGQWALVEGRMDAVWTALALRTPG